jgi:cytochrome b subunit of formate dehydrogenase
MLYGWKSMMPRPKDFADLWANLRYFLYLGPRPKLDRWTYWEKFDYFAVFWGVAIIGLSGLALWFPEAASAVLPGWALNAAYVIHSDEALLAVGFIFVFHFFHTHLRPEAFPMDPVIFLGAVPLERFKAERPLEYRRMVERDELEAHLVEAPSPERLRRARAWGLSAVAVGVLLVIGILWAFLTH